MSPKKTHVLCLSDNMVSCPIYWQKFVLSLPRNTILDRDERRKRITSGLAKFNAELIVTETGRTPTVFFNDEADFLLFVMRYS